MTKQYDLEYIDQGIFTAFVPVSAAGAVAWNQMAEETVGTGKVYTTQKQSTLAQLRAAGYRVRKAPKTTQADMDAVLKELFA